MKTWHNLCRGIGFLIFISTVLVACVNRISEEEGEVIDNVNIPLKFVADIRNVVNTRVANNSFEEGDEVGLFALAGNTTMQEERYVDNLHFVRSSNGEFISDESVYYPDDGVTLNLISYYPYQEKEVEMGESTMQVSVATNQHEPADYSHSDFLIASKENVSASKETVSLTYNHQFFRLKVALVPGGGENAENILSANPQLTVNGFYTEAVYDFQKNAISAYSAEKEITPAGEWELKEGRLIGKELILIPQETTDGYQYLALEVGGKSYISMLPSSLQLKSGKQRELEIVFVEDEDILISQVSGEIGDWDGTEVDRSESVTLHKYVNIAKLTFEKSNVYKVLNAGKQVAEICKEYLVTPEFSSQAIVAYPMKENGGVDLSLGTVVQLLDKSGKVHGGSISWNMEDNSPTYVAGTLAACNNVYVMADGNISLSISTTDNVLPVLALADVVRDVRGGMIHNYPLVKIGTQYWMRSNLEATLYLSGGELHKLEKVTENVTGYLESGVGYCLYTANVALSADFLPARLNIPDWKDWNVLNTYLKEDVSLLKSGTWLPLVTGGMTFPATDLSGFNAAPVGMWVETEKVSGNIYGDKHLAYWTLNEMNTAIADEVFYLKSDANTIGKAASGTERKALSIRCIRK